MREILMDRISLSARKEMLKNVKSRYKELNWIEKRKVIDGLCATTGYERKYAISLINNSMKKVERKKPQKNIQYGNDVKQALVTIWKAANQICSKRLVPFLPEMIEALERHNHLYLARSTRNKLSKISSSTVDRLLKPEKMTGKKCISTTRAYKKNNQAHVEEKNGSIIRRIIGYDRYEGVEALNKLTELYSVLRLYVNYFQPSVKLISKERDRSKVSKKYDKAKTPAKRLLASLDLPKEASAKVTKQTTELDPVALLDEIKILQNEFWSLAWDQGATGTGSYTSETNNQNEQKLNVSNTVYGISTRFYRKTTKPRKNVEHSWRTRKDPFVDDWGAIKQKLEFNPILTAKEIFNDLVEIFPNKYKTGNLRTLQRRIKDWREKQLDQQIRYNALLKSNQKEPAQFIRPNQDLVPIAI